MKIEFSRISFQLELSFLRERTDTGRQTWAMIVAFLNIAKTPKNGGWEVWKLVISLHGTVVYFIEVSDVTEEISNRINMPDQLLDTAPP
jgi:hypothetical protein